MIKTPSLVSLSICLLAAALTSCTAPRPYNPALGNRLENIERQEPVSPTPVVRKPLDDTNYGYGYYGGPRW